MLAAADAIDREFGLLCYTLLYTGRRIGDLLNSNTRLSNLNLDNGTLYFGKTKNGDPITVPSYDWRAIFPASQLRLASRSWLNRSWLN